MKIMKMQTRGKATSTITPVITDGTMIATEEWRLVAAICINNDIPTRAYWPGRGYATPIEPAQIKIDTNVWVHGWQWIPYQKTPVQQDQEHDMLLGFLDRSLLWEYKGFAVLSWFWASSKIIRHLFLVTTCTGSTGVAHPLPTSGGSIHPWYVLTSEWTFNISHNFQSERKSTRGVGRGYYFTIAAKKMCYFRSVPVYTASDIIHPLHPTH